MNEIEPTELAPDLMVPTPDQWIARWNTWTLDQRRTAAARIIRQSEEASRCFIEDHDGLQGQLRAISVALSEAIGREYTAYRRGAADHQAKLEQMLAEQEATHHG